MFILLFSKERAGCRSDGFLGVFAELDVAKEAAWSLADKKELTWRQLGKSTGPFVSYGNTGLFNNLSPSEISVATLNEREQFAILEFVAP